MKIGIGLALAAALALGACAYHGDDIGNPFYRKLQWFSFAGGDDLREACAAGGPDRLRLIYNAVWGEQLRIYEWDGTARDLRIRVVGPGNLAELTSDDLLAPWRAGETHVALSEADHHALIEALDAAGAFGPPAVGLDLPSREYYWLAATCHEGRFTVTGWRYPSPSFAAARFPALLFARDPGRDGVAQPRERGFDPFRADAEPRGAANDFLLTIGRNGLVK